MDIHASPCQKDGFMLEHTNIYMTILRATPTKLASADAHMECGKEENARTRRTRPHAQQMTVRTLQLQIQ
jgi:hypothetical protein